MTTTSSTQAPTGSVKAGTPAIEFTHRLTEVAGTVETFLVELVHCYSLVHDDLPAMDDDDMRRGKPTVHKAYDEATAILVGDALQTLAFEIVADPTWQPDARIRADLVLGLARASGLGGMVGGQLLDLTAEGRFGAATMDVDDTLRMQAMKTGAILAFSVEAGAIVGGADKDQRASLLRYGLALGQAFQIADDILDREASPEAMGKATGKDKDAGKATLVDRLGIDGARAECDRLVGVCEDAVGAWGESADPAGCRPVHGGAQDVSDRPH
jgi:farnesyl diphosphate synthase